MADQRERLNDFSEPLVRVHVLHPNLMPCTIKGSSVLLFRRQATLHIARQHEVCDLNDQTRQCLAKVPEYIVILMGFKRSVSDLEDLPVLPLYQPLVGCHEWSPKTVFKCTAWLGRSVRPSFV